MFRVEHSHRHVSPSGVSDVLEPPAHVKRTDAKQTPTKHGPNCHILPLASRPFCFDARSLKSPLLSGRSGHLVHRVSETVSNPLPGDEAHSDSASIPNSAGARSGSDLPIEQLPLGRRWVGCPRSPNRRGRPFEHRDVKIKGHWTPEAMTDLASSADFSAPLMLRRSRSSCEYV